MYDRTTHKGQRIPERRYHTKGTQSPRPQSKSTYQPSSLTNSGGFMKGSPAKMITGGNIRTRKASTNSDTPTPSTDMTRALVQSSVGFGPILDGSQATRRQGPSVESATRRRRRYLLFLSLILLLWSNQDVPEDHRDCQDRRLGANQERKNRGRSGRSVVHEDLWYRWVIYF